MACVLARCGHSSPLFLFLSFGYVLSACGGGAGDGTRSSGGNLGNTGGLSQGGSGGATPTGGSSGSGGLVATGGAGASSQSSGGAGTGGVGQIVGTITDLTIEPNPTNTLSVYVSWTTSEESSSVVQFGEQSMTWETSGAPGMQHKVLVIGMRPETAYQIRALSTGPSGTVEGMTTHESGAVPAHIPTATVSVHDEARAQPGWTLMNLQKGDGTTSAFSPNPPTAVAYDEEGYPVWYYVHGSGTERGGAISVDSTDVGVLIGPTLAGQGNGTPFAPIEVSWAGETVWTCDDPLCGVPDQLSHHAGKLGDGNYVVMRDATTAGVTSQVFLEFSPDNSTPVYEIGVEDGMLPPASATGDWAHGNAISIDKAADVAYLSFRWLGLMKMTYSTKTLQWHLPAKYGQEQLNVDFGDMTFDPPESQFSDIHDPEIHDDGTILFFDNGGFSFGAGGIAEGNPDGLQTRALEYSIDEDAQVATLQWEWPGGFAVDDWYQTELYVPFWGDADRLENGNVLITAGRRGGVDQSTPESRVIEVTKAEGEVVWELRLPKDHGVYRSERMAPPLLTKLAR